MKPIERISDFPNWVADIETIVNSIFNMQGHRIDNLQKGISIISMNDGKLKKVVKKVYANYPTK